MKKGAIAPFPFLVGVFGVVILLAIVSIIIVGYADLKDWNREPLGGKALSVFSAYQDAEEALLYIDQAARLAGNKAAYDLGQNGFYFSTSSCGVYEDYKGWSKGGVQKNPGADVCEATLTDCVPPNVNSFETYFTQSLHSIINDYTLPGVNTEISYDIDVSHGPGLRIVGTSANRVGVQKGRITYATNAGFNEVLDINLSDDHNYILDNLAGLHSVSKTEFDNEITALSELNEGYLWKGEYIKTCSSSYVCDVGNTCSEDVEEQVDPDCDPLIETCEIKKISKTGRKLQEYCSATAQITVNLVDSRYPQMIKKVVLEEGVRDFEYKFALNWFEMGEIKCHID